MAMTVEQAEVVAHRGTFKVRKSDGSLVSLRFEFHSVLRLLEMLAERYVSSDGKHKGLLIISEIDPSSPKAIKSYYRNRWYYFDQIRKAWFEITYDEAVIYLATGIIDIKRLLSPTEADDEQLSGEMNEI